MTSESLNHQSHRQKSTPSLQIIIAIALAIVGVQAGILFALGQPAICACGYVKLWHGAASSPETSQHISDWYTFSHILHGVIFYALLRLVFPRTPTGILFLAALGIEAAWEIAENTPMIVERYRRLALAQGYSGDSALNSVFDLIAAAVGFFIARLAPVWATMLMAVAFEVGVGFAIRDNLTLNVIQLLYPLEAISRWQAGG